MKIIQIARHIQPGSGVAGVANALEVEFRQLGLECQRFTLAESGIKFRTQIGRSLLSKALLLVEVVWFTIAGTVMAARLSKKPGVRVIVHGDAIGGHVYVNHGLLKAARQAQRLGPVPANPMHWFTLARDSWRYRHGAQDAIVCLNEWDRGELQRLYKRVPSPIEVISNGVATGDYAYLAEGADRDAIRSELGFDADDLVVLFIGHEYERKGLFLLAEAMNDVEPNVKLLVVGGSDDMIANAKIRMKYLVSEGRVVFAGRWLDARPGYSACDLVALPSAYETGPLVLFEALAAGRPCVSSLVGAAPRLIRSGVTGEMVERNAPSVRRGIESVAGMLNQDGADTVAARCRGVAQLFDWSRIARQYLALLGVELPK